MSINQLEVLNINISPANPPFFTHFMYLSSISFGGNASMYHFLQMGQEVMILLMYGMSTALYENPYV